MKVNADVKGNPLPCELYLDGYLKDNLDILYKLVVKDWDGINVTWGYEGDGKSVFELQKNLYMDANFNLDHVVFTPKQFEECIDSAPKQSAILWDEADILAGNWWDEILQALKSKFKRIRSKNLFVSLVTPTVFDMDKYFVIHRTRFGVEVYSSGADRGFFKFFDREKKKTMFLKGRRDWNTNVVKPSFYGRFMKLPEGFPIDMEAYNIKKDEATRELIALQGLSKAERVVRFRRDVLGRLTKFVDSKYSEKWTQEEYAHLFGVDRSAISRDLDSN